MSKPTPKHVLPEQGTETDPISLLLRKGAQKLVANAICEEFLQFKQDHTWRLTDYGRPEVVRDGYHPQR